MTWCPSFVGYSRTPSIQMNCNTVNLDYWHRSCTFSRARTAGGTLRTRSSSDWWLTFYCWRCSWTAWSQTHCPRPCASSFSKLQTLGMTYNWMAARCSCWGSSSSGASSQTCYRRASRKKSWYRYFNCWCLRCYDADDELCLCRYRMPSWSSICLQG